MTIDIENVREWANSGDVSEPSTTKQDDGYEGAEQPFNEHHNWIWNFRDKKTNQTSNRLNRTHIANPGTAIGAFCEGKQNVNTDWIHPYGWPNTKDLGSDTVINMCRGWNYALKQPVIYAVYKGDSTKIVEFRNDNSVGNDFDIDKEDHAITLDAPGSENIEAICCDGPNIYLLCEVSGSTKLYKFNVNPWSASKVASKSVSISQDTAGLGRNAIIVANANLLAFIGRGEHGGSNKVINTVTKDLVTVVSGRGNSPVSTTYFPGTGLVSDQSTVFFTFYSTTTDNLLLCAADLSDLSTATGTGGAFGTKIIGDDTKKAGGIIYDGRHISVLRDDGYVASFNKDIDRWRTLDFQFENAKSPDEDFPKLVYDGFTAWSILQHDGDDDSNNGFVAPLRVNEICLDHPTTRTIQKKEFLSTYTDGATIMEDTRMIYSDGCLWISPKVASTSPGTQLFRIPNLMNRR